MTQSSIDIATIDFAEELRRRWRRGECVRAEEIFTLHPQLRDDPESAIDLIYEEYNLRCAAGEHDVEHDILRRFPQWAAPLRVMFDCHHRVLESDDQPQLPGVGDRVADFRVLSELGRGA